MKIKFVDSALVLRSVFCTALSGAVFLSPHALRAETSKSDVPAGVSASDWQGIRAAHEAWKHEVRKVDGGWEAQNPAQQWTTTFDGRGFVAKPANADWSWGLELRAYGAGDVRCAATSAPEVKTEGQRLAYHWDDTVQEWFINDGRGLEHGFSVQERPAGPADAPLSFILATRGPLIAEVTSDARAVDYRTAAGSKVLTYSGLRVWDADGRDLPSRFVPAEGGVELQVDATGARYPVTIDPIAQQAVLKAPNPAAERYFGYSAAISGDTVVVGEPGKYPYAGSAYVFVRSRIVGLTYWVQQAHLQASNGMEGDFFGHSVAISGDTVVVTAPYAKVPDPNHPGEFDTRGAIYVFARSVDYGTNPLGSPSWAQQAFFRGPEGLYPPIKSIAAAISGDTVVVGWQHWRSDNIAYGSAVHIFQRSESGSWNLSQELGDLGGFGFSVAVSGDWIAVGAPYTQTSRTVNIGGVSLFRREGSQWVGNSKWLGWGKDNLFGSAVALSGNTLLVGSPGRMTSRANTAVIFEHKTVSGVTRWYREANLSYAWGNDEIGYGASVALSEDGNRAVVGAPYEPTGGRAYLWTRDSSGSWGNSFTQRLVGPTEGGARFGYAVAISSDTSVVGSPFASVLSASADLLPKAGAVYVYRDSADASARLDSLISSTGSLSPSFDSNSTYYKISLGNEIDSITFTPTVPAPLAGDPAATVAVRVNDGDYTPIQSGQSTGAIPLDVGVNLVEFRVVAAVGATTQSYYVEVTRAPSAEASLSDLVLLNAALSPVFSSAITDYSANVGISNESIRLVPTAASDQALLQVRINGGDFVNVDSGKTLGPFVLEPGLNNVDVKVTAQNEKNTRTYRINVSRGSANAKLADLTLNNGMLAPVFSGDVIDYDASVANGISSITLKAIPEQQDATVWVSLRNNDYLPSNTDGIIGPIPLVVGVNALQVQVTAQDGATFALYNVWVVRAPSSDANLGSLNLSAGLLSPAFSGGTNYTAGVDFSTKSITLTPNVAQADATIQVRVNGGAYSSITNGTASGALALGVGKNTIEVKVTAQDGTTTKTYAIEVTRDPMIIQTVAVGDAGNAPDVTGYGAVSYPYRIGKYEITLGEYAEFLNAVARNGDPYGLYPMGWGGPELMRADVAGISRDFTNGVYTFTPVTPVGVNPAGADSPANRPVSFMTLFNAARFANWLANGQPSGGQDATTTEDGAYALNGATSGTIARNATNPNTGAPPTWWIPTENEWYKAAYYKGGGTNAGYWLYPTQSDTKPGNTIGAASNQANHKLLNGAGDAWVYSVPNVVNALYSQNALTDVGAFSNSASAYGTFDQGGNVWEWNHTQVGDSYLIRGGDYGSANADSRDFLKSSADQVSIPAHWKGYSGFRMATLPNAVASPRILSISRGVNGFSLSWTNGPNVHVQRRTSLSTGAWETISSNNTTGTHLDTAPPANRGFYRLIVP